MNTNSKAQDVGIKVGANVKRGAQVATGAVHGSAVAVKSFLGGIVLGLRGKAEPRTQRDASGFYEIPRVDSK